MSTAPPIVIWCGVPHWGCVVPSALGSRPSRPMAKPIRPMVTSSTIITEVSPMTAPSEMSALTQCSPTASNADASGALTSIVVYSTMPVSTSETPR